MTENNKIGEVKAVMLLSAGFYIMGLAVSYFLGLETSFISMTSVSDSIIATLGVFIFAVLFFGFLTPLLLLSVGLSQRILVSQNIFSLIFAAQFFVAAYAGTLLGIKALKDLKGEGNLASSFKKEILLMTIAILLSVISPFIADYAQGLLLA